MADEDPQRFSMANQLAIRRTSPNTFESVFVPRSMGNNQPMAYGGSTIGLAVHSAALTVPSASHIYSVLGAFHGPTRIDLPLKTTVTTTRSTKTFQTRRVVATQTLPTGPRTCLDILVDFHMPEAAMYTYSAPPVLKSSPRDSSTAPTEEVAKGLLAAGHISPEQLDTHKSLFSLTSSFETRQVRDSVTGQNLKGLAKAVPTTQDHLPITDKVSSEWYRLTEPLGTDAENVACLAFIMDAALSFLPLNHDHKNLSDVGPCSTLDFALRFLKPAVRMDEWHVVERRTIGAAVGRTYSETRMWSEDGTLVAVNNQTCIARPLKPAAKI